MTRLSDLFPDIANSVAKKWFKVPGTYNFTIPAGGAWLRASGRGCGGQGDLWGGGGCFAKSKRKVTPGDNLIIQVGTASQQSAAGDSFVKFNDGTVIIYCDRGRGNGTQGKAEFSSGDIVREGGYGTGSFGGAAGDDVADVASIFGPAPGVVTKDTAPGPGAGGRLAYHNNSEGDLIRDAWPAGPGIVVLEFFDGDPGL
jgi:hypothetical protein